MKFCGFTRAEDAATAVAFGVDLVGMIFVPGGRRTVDPERAREIVVAVGGEVRTVGVFAGADLGEILRLRREVKFDLVQLHGGEEPEFCAALEKKIGPRVIRAFRGPDEVADAPRFRALFARLFDAPRPGAGIGWDWRAVAAVPRDRPVILAGGLDPENLERAVRLAAPEGVDVATGIESAPGIKDDAKMRDFLRAARALAPEEPEEADLEMPGADA